MLTQICQYLRNWFEREKYLGDFKITNGAITAGDGSALPLLSGQYFRIVGSILNDGVHNTADTLTDEEFSGAVWSMAIPPIIIELADEIEVWVTNNAQAINSPYQSESFGGYSYSLRSATSGSGAVSAPTWETQFSARLAPWRKI